MKTLRVFFCVTIFAATVADGFAAEPPQFADAGKEVPSHFVHLGEEGAYGILVEKSTQTLFVYDNNHNFIKTVTVTTGKNHGTKMQTGDMKTPEGVYFFTDVIDKKKLLPEYGVIALPTNYPNLIDEVGHKNGGGIWLHATNQPTRPLKPYDTKGCVVAVNEDILDVARYVDLELTPIVIIDKVVYTSPERLEAERTEVNSFLTRWRDAWEKKDIESYISSYTEDFSSRGMDLRGWRAYKEGLNRQYSHIRVGMSGIKILKYNDYVVVVFKQDYQSDGYRALGIKRLYLMKEKNEWKIAREECKEVPTKSPKVIANAYFQKAFAKDGTVKSRTDHNQIRTNTDHNVDIEGFSVARDKALRVQFRLVNKLNNGKKIKGRLAIVVEGKNGKGTIYNSYPPISIRNGKPLDFKDGEWFSIRRLKVVKGKIDTEGLEGGEIGHLKVLIYSQEGRPILVKEFSGEGIVQ